MRFSPTVLLLILIFIVSCNNDSLIYKEFAINFKEGKSDSSGQWYKVISSFKSGNKCIGESFASSHLCYREQSKDTVLVVTPCSYYGFKKGEIALLFPLDEPYTKDVIKIALPIGQELSKYLKVYGALKIPID